MNDGLLFNPCNEIHDPFVYGNLHLSYSDYVAPGMIIRYGAIDHLSIITLCIQFCGVTFGISIALIPLSFVTKRKEGLLDRI